MAYSLQLFARSGEPVAQRAAPALIDAASRLDPDLRAVHERDSIGVAQYEVFSRHDAGIDTHAGWTGGVPLVSVAVVANCGPAEMAEQIDRGGPARLLECDTRIDLILTGGQFTDATWTAVRAICQAATDLWNAVLYDEMDGFTVTIDDL